LSEKRREKGEKKRENQFPSCQTLARFVSREKRREKEPGKSRERRGGGRKKKKRAKSLSPVGMDLKRPKKKGRPKDKKKKKKRRATERLIVCAPPSR